MADVVNDENIADKPLHLGGDIGVALIEIETVDAFAEGRHKRHEPGIGRIGDVVDAKPGILEFVTPAGAGLVLGIGDHEITHHAHLVGVRELVRHHQPADDLRLARVGHVEDRRPLGSVLVTDIGVMPLDHDLAPARQLRAAEMTNIRRCLRRRAGITGMEDVGHDSISRAPGRFLRRPLCSENLRRKQYPGRASAATSSAGWPGGGMHNCVGGQWTAPSFQPTITSYI